MGVGVFLWARAAGVGRLPQLPVVRLPDARGWAVGVTGSPRPQEPAPPPGPYSRPMPKALWWFRGSNRATATVSLGSRVEQQAIRAWMPGDIPKHRHPFPRFPPRKRILPRPCHAETQVTSPWHSRVEQQAIRAWLTHRTHVPRVVSCITRRAVSFEGK